MKAIKEKSDKLHANLLESVTLINEMRIKIDDWYNSELFMADLTSAFALCQRAEKFAKKVKRAMEE